jgi:hypothetical protein
MMCDITAKKRVVFSAGVPAGYICFHDDEAADCTLQWSRVRIET